MKPAPALVRRISTSTQGTYGAGAGVSATYEVVKERSVTRSSGELDDMLHVFLDALVLYRPSTIEKSKHVQLKYEY
jgi:hypothetical protein